MQTSPNKIAFLIPSLESGGMERVMSEVVKYIAGNCESECHLILYGKSDKQFYDIPERVIVHTRDFKFNDNIRLWMAVKTMIFIRSTIKDIIPNSILSFGEIWNNLVLLSLVGIKIPIFLSDRSSPRISHGFFQDNLRKILYPRSAGVIAQTSSAKNIFKTQFKNANIRVIGNPIRVINNQNLNVIKRENIVISIGRLIDTKHFDKLIDIFVKLNCKDWKLIIIGGDSNKQLNSVSLRNTIRELRMENSVFLAGIQKNVDDYLLKASVFAFTSSSEGFPNVIGEAMAAGLPVIAYDCVAGPSEMIEDGRNGYLIPLFDDIMFADKLRLLMENERIRIQMGEYAKESIKKFSVENIGKQYYDFITSKKV